MCAHDILHHFFCTIAKASSFLICSGASNVCSLGIWTVTTISHKTGGLFVRDYTLKDSFRAGRCLRYSSAGIVGKLYSTRCVCVCVCTCGLNICVCQIKSVADWEWPIQKDVVIIMEGDFNILFQTPYRSRFELQNKSHHQFEWMSCSPNSSWALQLYIIYFNRWKHTALWHHSFNQMENSKQISISLKNSKEISSSQKHSFNSLFSQKEVWRHVREKGSRANINKGVELQILSLG